MSFFSAVTDVFKSVGGALNPIMPILGVGTSILGSVMGANAH